MNRWVQSNVLKVLVLTCLLIPIFQNCSRPGTVKFEGQGPSIKFGGNQNGDGYLGKPPTGDYVRSFLDFSCINGGVPSGLQQGLMKVDASSAVIVEDNCQDFSYAVPFNDPRLDYVPYNPDFLGINLAVYEKKASFDAAPGSAVEAFCRQANDSDGIDVVAKINSAKQASIKIYSGTSGNGETWSSQTVPFFSVQRKVAGAQIEYSSGELSLRIDASNASQPYFAGRFDAKIDGRAISKVLSCRTMRVDSAINYSDAGLVGLWQLNGTYMDISGNGNHLEPLDTNNTLAFLPGVLRQALKLDGANDRLRLQPNPLINNIAQLTVAGWIKPAVDVYGSTTHGGIAHKTDAVGVNTGWEFGIGAMTRKLHFRAAFDGGDIYKDTPGNLALDAWNHVAVTWDGTANTSGLKIFVNGVEQVASVAENGSGLRTDDSELPLYVGDFSDYPANFEGEMDQMGLWNRVLSPTEIRSLFSTGSPTP